MSETLEGKEKDGGKKRAHVHACTYTKRFYVAGRIKVIPIATAVIRDGDGVARNGDSAARTCSPDRGERRGLDVRTPPPTKRASAFVPTSITNVENGFLYLPPLSLSLSLSLSRSLFLDRSPLPSLSSLIPLVARATTVTRLLI